MLIYPAPHDPLTAATARLTTEDLTISTYDHDDHDGYTDTAAYITDPYGEEHPLLTITYTLNSPEISRYENADSIRGIIPDDAELAAALDAWATVDHHDNPAARREELLALLSSALEDEPDALGEVTSDLVGVPDDAQRTAVIVSLAFSTDPAVDIRPGAGTIALDLHCAGEDAGEDGPDSFPLPKLPVSAVVDQVLRWITATADAEIARADDLTAIQPGDVNAYRWVDAPEVAPGSANTARGFICGPPSWARRLAVPSEAHRQAMETTRRQRDSVIRAAAADGVPKATIARATGLSRPQIYSILGR